MYASTSSSTPQSDEAEALYAIMACAVETGPQLVLQMSVLLIINYEIFEDHPTPIVLCSIVACFLSGAFNGGRAIMYVSNQRNNIRSYACAMLGGTHSFEHFSQIHSENYFGIFSKNCCIKYSLLKYNSRLILIHKSNQLSNLKGFSRSQVAL